MLLLLQLLFLTALCDEIRVYRAPSYTGMLFLAAFMSIGVGALWLRRISLDRLYNKSLWCMISLKAFIYPGSDFQFVAETFIVMLLYVAATTGIIMIHHVDETVDAKKKKVYLFGGVALFSVAFSLVLSVFRKKYQGYPYSFFFK